MATSQPTNEQRTHGAADQERARARSTCLGEYAGKKEGAQGSGMAV